MIQKNMNDKYATSAAAKLRQTHAGAPMTGAMETFHVDNGTPGILFSAVHHQ